MKNQVLFDPSTEKVLLRASISREAQVLVVAYGNPDIAALDKLIEMLVTLRNGWAEEAAK